MLALISVAVGLVLAGVYHFVAVWLQHRITRSRHMLSPVLTLSGFFLRLAVFAAIFFALGTWSSLDILAVSLAFIGLFTVLNGIRLYSLAFKHRGASPSAGAPRAN